MASAADLKTQAHRVEVRLMGSLAVLQDGRAIVAPASRKARAILGYLLLSDRPVSRQRLCDLFFDLPDDPRAALRWSLSMIRPLVDGAGGPRLLAERDQLRVRPEGLWVDARSLRTAAAAMETISDAELDALVDGADGPLMMDCELPERPEYAAWLAAARQDVDAALSRVLWEQVRRNADKPAARIRPLQRLVTIDPLDERAYAELAAALLKSGRAEEARNLASQAERALRQAGFETGPALRTIIRGGGQPAERSTPANAPYPRDQTDFDALRHGLAVIPFSNHAPQALSQSDMAAFLESVVHGLGRFSWFSVAGLSGALQFDGAIADPARMGAALGAARLAGGSLRISEDRVLVRWRLVDAATGALIGLGDLESDEAASPQLALGALADTLVTHIAAHVMEAEMASAEQRPPDRCDGLDHLWRGFAAGMMRSPISHAAAADAFRAALTLDPGSAAAMALLAWAQAHLLAEADQAGRSEAAALARQAIARGPRDAHALAMAAWTLVQLEQDFDAAMRAVDRAVRLNPLSRIAWSASGWILAMAGEFERPMEHWDRAERCNPLVTGSDQAYAGRALCCWLHGRHEEARTWAARCLALSPDHPGGLLADIAAKRSLGDHEGARSSTDRFKRHYPAGFDAGFVSSIPIRDPELRAQLLSTLRAA